MTFLAILPPQLPWSFRRSLCLSNYFCRVHPPDLLVTTRRGGLGEFTARPPGLAVFRCGTIGFESPYGYTNDARLLFEGLVTVFSCSLSGSNALVKPGILNNEPFRDLDLNQSRPKSKQSVNGLEPYLPFVQRPKRPKL